MEEEFEYDEEYEYEDYETYEEEADDDLTFSDFAFLGGGVIILCGLIAFIFKQIRKTFKNVHLKVGDKIEVGVETNLDKKE